MERKTEKPAIECEIPEAIREACKASGLDIVRAKLVLSYGQLDWLVAKDGVLFERTIAVVEPNDDRVYQIDERGLEQLRHRLQYLSDEIQVNGLDVKFFDNCLREEEIRDFDTGGFWYNRRWAKGVSRSFGDRRDKYTFPQLSAFERIGERIEEHRILVNYEESAIKKIKDELKANGCKLSKKVKDKKEKTTKVPIVIRNRVILYPCRTFEWLQEIYKREKDGLPWVYRDLGGPDKKVEAVMFDDLGFCRYLDVKAFPGLFPDGRIRSEKEKPKGDKK